MIRASSKSILAIEEIMLSISNLNVGYGESPVIQNVSFTLESGSATAIVGRNGMGKSTLLKAIVGMIPAASGSIKLDNKELFGLPSFKRVQAGVAYVPQGRMIFPQLTVEENILSGLETQRYDGIPAFVHEFFPVLSEMRTRKGGNLSGGQQQQLAIARALVSKPQVLILDEPTEGIQPSIIKEIAQSLNRLRKELGIAVLVTEQVLSFAMEVADQLLVIDRGQIVRTMEKSNIDLNEVRSFLTV
jgi:urea transport system ATP-binding protein